MNLLKLFEMQRKLDERIIKEKGLEGMDRLPYLIQAFHTELGELSNEWRGFKFWSIDREPRTKVRIACQVCRGTGEHAGINYEIISCRSCGGKGYVAEKNPLLEEYVDCLHFLLSIGLEMFDFKQVQFKFEPWIETDLIKQFIYLNLLSGYLYLHSNQTNAELDYNALFNRFIGLGMSLGFTWEQIEQAYMEKNRVNHERQAQGY